MKYAALWVKSNFSFLEGASHPEELVEQAHALGLSALCLTDRDGVYGVVRAHQRAQELGLKLIIGAQISVEREPRALAARNRATSAEQLDQLLLLVSNRTGYTNLCQLISTGRLRAPKGSCSVSWQEVLQNSEGLIALLGPQSPLAAPQSPPTLLKKLLRAFDQRLYALCCRHRLAEEVEGEQRLRQRATQHSIPLVAANEVLYHHPDRRSLQDVLTCIRHGIKLEQAGRRLRANAEHHLHAPDSFSALFRDLPRACERTLEIAERCSFSLADLRYRYPSERLPDGTSSAQRLRQLSFEGASWRYGGQVPPAVVHQLERELELIEELDYPGYFLTMWEIVEFCRSRQILCQGRGSAANSVVCYCLGITAVDPIQLDLLFERFISRERPDPPDIDLDIEHERREELIQHVYQRYGRSHAAMVAVVVRYRTRSALREIGKVLGVPLTALDRLSKLCHRHGPGAFSREQISEEQRDRELWQSRLQEAGLDPHQPRHHHLVALVKQIEDFPRHLSIHPGGFLLGDQPIHTLVPQENASMERRTVIQWDKEDLEALGLFKVDLLGLGALSLLRRGFDLLLQHRQLQRSLATIPRNDGATFALMRKADTVGVFQIESRAQMAMLPRLRPRVFYDLVIQVSIVRPGPIAGDMVHPYLRRRHGQEQVRYPHPCLEPVLAKTLGVPLFQEQVMRLAVVAADYTPGEADQLRRDMAAWRRHGRLEQHRERLISRMTQKGIAPHFAQRVFEQIRGFGEYGFPESHAASFALIAYGTAWMRCHHLDIFTCALLNAQPLGFYTPASIVEDARRHGLPIRPVDVRFSGWDCTLEPSEHPRHLALRMGLRYVARLGESAGQRLALEAQLRSFSDLDDFVRRSRLNEGQLTALAEGGALEGLGLSRRAALWEVRRLLRERRDSLALPGAEALPRLPELNPMEVIRWDYQATHHSPRAHPLQPLRPLLQAQGLSRASQLNRLPHGSATRYAGLVIDREQPGTARGVVFMTLEDESGFVNLVLWPDVFERNAVLARTEAFLGITGKIQSEQGVVHLVVKELWLPSLERPATAQSRDFH